MTARGRRMSGRRSGPWSALLRGLAGLGVTGVAGCGPLSSPEAQPPPGPRTEAAGWREPLAEGDPAQREAAALALAETPDPAAVGPLVRAAEHDHQPRVRIAAVRALAVQPGPVAGEALFRLLADPSAQVRVAVCQALARRPGPEAAATLFDLLDGEPALPVRLAAVSALGRMGEDAAEGLARRLPEAGPDERRLIVGILARSARAQDADLLASAAEADAGALRLTAAEALARTGDPRAIPALTGLIREPLGPADKARFQSRREHGPTSLDLQAIVAMLDEELRRQGRSVPPGLHGNHYFSPRPPAEHFGRFLDREMEGERQTLRTSAAQALLRTGADEALEALAGFLGDEEPGVAAAAEAALADMDEGRADRLHAWLRDPARPSASRVRTLDLLLARARGAAAAADRDWERVLEASLLGEEAPSGPADGPASSEDIPARLREDLLALLDDPAPDLRFRAAEALAGAGEGAAGDVLTAFVDGDDRTRQARAAEALGRLGHRPAVPALLRRAGASGPEEPRRQAIRALGRIGDPEAVTPLLDRVRAGDRLEPEILHALTEIGDPRVGPVLTGLLKSRTDRAGRERLMGALGRIRHREAVPVLIETVERSEDPIEVRAAMAALGHIGDPAAVGPISEALLRPPLLVRHWTDQVADAHGIPALVRIQDPQALDTLARLGRREGPEHTVRTAAAAIRAMGRFDHPRAAELLADLLADGELDLTRKHAAVAPALLEAGPRAVAPLVRLVREAPPAETSAEFDPGVYAAELLAFLGEEGHRALLDLAGSDLSPTGMRRVVDGLRRLDDDRALSVLTGLIGHADSETRLSAVRALARVRHPGADDVLGTAATHDDPEVRRWAAWSLERRREMAGGRPPQETEERMP